MRKRLMTIVIVLAALAVTLAACGGAEPQPTEVPPTEEMVEPTATVEKTSLTPAVEVEDQNLKEELTVPVAVSDGPGWVVIHANDDGSPGQVIGHAALSDGENEDVSVVIDTEAATSKLFAMLHTDSGEKGTYEFPDGDPPVKVEGGIVVKPFTVEKGEESMGTEVTLAESDEYGPFLADSEGMALYLFTKDNENTSNCYDDCAKNWPPLVTEGEPVAGEGVDGSLLGTTERKDGSKQVTYNGWPLYYFFQDENPGDTNGQEVGGVWFLLAPDGKGIGREKDSSGYDY